MRRIRPLVLAVASVLLASMMGCGGTDQRPEWPDPAVTDRSADDMGLAEVEAEPEPEPEPVEEDDEEPAEEGDPDAEETDDAE